MLTLEFLDNISKNKIIPIMDTFSDTVESFYDNTIRTNLPDAEVVIKWHSILMRYVNEDGAIFFIRKYGNAPKKQWNLLRRGFLTKFNNASFIYCDNFLAHYFFNMAIEGYVPEYEDFKNTMFNLKFPYGYMETKGEIELRASPRGKTPKINSSGWKLAHIYSVGQADYSFDYKKTERNLFTIGNYEDWIKGEKGAVLRPNESSLSIEELITIKTHFLRLVHPINYFLVPKQKHHQSDVGNNIGENEILLEFMKGIQQNKYGELFTEYKNSIAALDKRSVIQYPGKMIININITKTAKTLDKVAKAVKLSKKGKVTSLFTDSSNEIKIGDLVKKSLCNLVKNFRISQSEIELLQDKAFSKETFNINFPFLKKIDPTIDLAALRVVNGYPRYWKEVFTINETDYLLCKEWYEESRSYFKNWLTNDRNIKTVMEVEERTVQSWILTRDVLIEECPWLDRKYKRGEIVYTYSGITYKLIGKNGFPFTLDPDTLPFFELPENAVKAYHNPLINIVHRPHHI
jgi:hypothetical protein